MRGRSLYDGLRHAHSVRRRVQVLSVLTILGWAAVLAAMWTTRARGSALFLGLPFRTIALAAAALSALLVLVSILQVRRLPSDAEAGHLARYPRRLR